MKMLTGGEAVVGVAAIAGLAVLATKHPALVAAVVERIHQALSGPGSSVEVLRAENCMLDGEADALARENAQLRLRIAELEQSRVVS